jgi:hypothetical protein
MNAAKFRVFVRSLFVAGSLLALGSLPAQAELLVGISFPSQGGSDNDTSEIDETLLTLPKLHLQDTSWSASENRNSSSYSTIYFTIPATNLSIYYPHQDLFFTNVVSPSYSYSFGPATFDRNGNFSTGLKIREQLPPPPLRLSVGGKAALQSSAVSDSSISDSVTATALQPVTGILTVTLNQNTLTLDWPADHIGWTLQTRTNVGINSQWFPIPGSSTINHLDLLLDRANSSVFYRLVAP